MHPMRTSLALSLVVLAGERAVTANATAQAQPVKGFTGEFRVDLADAIWREKVPNTRHPLQVRMYCDAGR